jgi:hypothetical protein
VATVDQVAAERGVTPNQRTGREAVWQSGEPDVVAPNFDAAWAGSPEEREQAKKVERYAAATRRRLWGESRGTEFVSAVRVREDADLPTFEGRWREG